MPEGDSLHRLARKLRQLLVDKHVGALALPRSNTDCEGIMGQAIVGVEARGKNLLVYFNDGLCLHVHLKMLGRVYIVAKSSMVAGRETVALLSTDSHTVCVEHAPVARLIRKQDLVRDLHFRHLGPDLLSPEFDMPEAITRLRRRDPHALGEALMDQSAVAGIGNVWKSELCFQCKLDPFSPVASCDDAALQKLLELGREQMAEHVAPRRRSILPDPFALRKGTRRTRRHVGAGESALFVYERRGQPCYECGTAVAMGRQGEQRRSTYFCPQCQAHRPPA